MTATGPLTDSSDALRQFARDGSEESFALLMGEHLDHVYSVASRRMGGDTHLARDVTQTVFTDLARQLRTHNANLSAFTPLSGWLHQHTCFVSSKLVRTEQRRRSREGIAAMSVLHDNSTNWSQLAPVIDEAVSQLPDSDRIAVLARFYERRDLRALGHQFGISEDAAQKRVSRALDRLRDILTHQGITSTAAALSVALGQQAIGASPSGLLASVCSAAITDAAAPAFGATASPGLALGKLHTVGTILAVMALSSVIVIQKRETSALKATHRELERRVKALTQAAAEPVNVSPTELEHLRNEHAELLRLRGQVAALRADAVARAIASHQVKPPTLALQPNGALAPDEIVLTETRGIGPGETAAPDSKSIQRVAKVIGQTINPEELINAGAQSPLDTIRTLLWAALRNPTAFASLIANDSSMLGPSDKAIQAEHLRDRLITALGDSNALQVELMLDAPITPSGKTILVSSTKPGDSKQSRVSLTVKPVQDHWELEQLTFSESTRPAEPLPWDTGAGK